MTTNTPRLRIPYPDPEDSLATYPATAKLAAEQVENMLQLAAGNGSATFNNAVQTLVAVTFPPNRFSSPPGCILVTPRTSLGLYGYAQSGLSATGVTIALRTLSGAAITGTSTFDWFAARLAA